MLVRFRRYLVDLTLGLALSGPFALAWFWHRTNRSFPQDDSGYFFSRTVEIYSDLKNAGLAHALMSAYSNPGGGKPILRSSLDVVSLLISGGDIRTAVCFSSFLSLSLVMVSAWLLLRDSLPGRLAVLGTALFGLYPFVVGNSYRATPYFPYLGFALLGLYFLKKSDSFSKRSQSLAAGVTLGLSFCMRPVETVIFFSVPLLLLTLKCFGKKILRLPDLILLVVLTALPLIGFYLSVKNGWNPAPESAWKAALPLFAFTAALPLVGRFLGLNRNYALTLMLFFSISFLWMYPHANELYEWAFAGTFSKQAAFNNVGRTTSAMGFIWKYLSIYGGLPLLALGLIGASALPMKSIRSLSWLVVASFLWMVFAPVVIASGTSNFMLLYYLPGASLLVLVFIRYALDPEKPFLRSRVSVTAVLLPLFLVCDFSMISVNGSLTRWVNRAVPWDFSIAYRPDRFPDRSLQVVTPLLEKIPHQRQIFGFYNSYTPYSDLPGDAQLRMASFSMRVPWDFYPVDDSRDGTTDRCKTKIMNDAHSYSYLLVGATEGTVNRVVMGCSDCTMMIVDAWKNSKLKDLGLELVDQVDVSLHDVGVFHYLIIKSQGVSGSML